MRPDQNRASNPGRNFNPRTPVGPGAGAALHRTCGRPEFQSTHPSGVRPYHAGDECVDCRISIHAPQWGATSNQLVGISFVFLISIHAPQWGATGRFGNHVEHRTDFNPRTPVGCDWVMVPPVVMLPRFQSTHPSGVRPTATRTAIRVCNFNPRTPVGCDLHQLDVQLNIIKFQSTHPSGVRQNLKDTINGKAEFQSTHPSGVRHAPLTYASCICQFQSTHPSGVRRLMAITIRGPILISIHAPQGGATLGFKQLELLVHFNSRTSVGCDCLEGQSLSICLYFNPRTPVGCDAPAHTL